MVKRCLVVFLAIFLVTSIVSASKSYAASNKLSNIILSQGTLEISVENDVANNDYAIVDNATTSITVTPFSNGDLITVAGIEVTSGVPSQELELQEGANLITVKVYNTGGSTYTYRFNVFRHYAEYSPGILEIMNIPDDALASNINGRLNRGSSPAPLTNLDLEQIEYINLENSSISNLEGMQYLINMHSLYLTECNQLENVQAISDIPNLNKLEYNCRNEDTVFAELISEVAVSSIKELWVKFQNGITDEQKALMSNLNNLDSIALTNCKISEISFLSGLSNPTRLILNHNLITEISGLENLTNLTYVDLGNNYLDAADAVNDGAVIESLNEHASVELRYQYEIRANQDKTDKNLYTKGGTSGSYVWGVDVYHGRSITLLDCDPREGYIFEGWDANNDGHVDFQAGDNVVIAPDIPTEGTTVNFTAIYSNDSNNTYISELSASDGTWDQSFNQYNTEYNIDVDETVETIELNIELDDPDATLKIMGETGIELTDSVLLQPGLNHINLKVTSRSGDVNRYYHLTIRRGNTVPFASGDGTEQNPYGISTPYQLNEIRRYPDAHFIMLNNLDLTAATSEGGMYYHDGDGWEPIGMLNGSFNGNDFCIIGLNLYRPEHKWGYDFVGLFERIGNDARIENLGIIDSYITSTDHVGGIVGWNFGLVNNCYYAGEIYGNDCDSVGGIAGRNEGEVTNCYNKGAITADGIPTGCGGIVGVGDGIVRECFNTGDITILSYNGHAGGIQAQGDPTIENCYNSGHIFSNQGAGGILGYESSTGAVIRNCYNVGNIGDASDGGIMGVSGYNKSQIINCYFLNNKDEAVGYYSAVEENVEQKSNEELQQQGTFAGFDFSGVWTMDGSIGYPYPELSAITHKQENKSEVLDIGNGLPYAPYQISTIEQLDEIRNIKGANYVLNSDIDLTSATSESGVYYYEGTGWDPIGIRYGSFFGSFDAGGYSITGLIINRPDQDYVGLFGYVASDAEIKDLLIYNCNITGHDYTGAIAGYTEGTQINCNISGSVSGNAYVGGVCGKKAKEGKIFICNNSANVSGRSDIGGIAGQVGDSGDMYEGKVINCSNSGDISGTYSVGGIVGLFYYGSDNNGDISLCYNTGLINATGNSGGIVGTMIVGHINQCYNTGRINGVGDGYNAGICGNLRGYITDCFNMGIVDGSSYCSGIAGYADAEIINCYNVGNWPRNMSSNPIVGLPYMGGTDIINCYYLDDIADEDDPDANTIEELMQQSTYSGFDFTNIWSIEEGTHYPILKGLPFVYVTGMDIQQNEVYLIIDETSTLDSDITPNNASSMAVRWHTSASNVASVSLEGVVTAKVCGTATITATTTDGNYTDSCTIIVIAPVAGVSLDKKTIELCVGEHETLTEHITPSWATNKTVTWSSSDEGVAVVSDGTVTAVSAGTATITVTTEDGGYTDTCTVTVIQPIPETPTVTATSASYSSVKISWNAISDATGYEVYRATSSDGTYTKIYTTTSGSSVSYTNTSLTTGKTYYYKVRAYQTVSGTNVYGSDSSVKSATPVPATPSVTAASASYSSIKISWSKVSGASGYKVYRATSSNGTYTRVATITSGSMTSYTNTGLTTGKTYYYKVRAYRTVDGAKVYSNYSPVKSATPVPSTPSVTATSASYSSVKISWNAISDATGYEVYRATSSDGTYTKIYTTTSGSSVSYTNTSLTTGKTYYYKVRAYQTVSGTNVYGSDSSVKSATPVPATPSVTAASASYSSIKISWSKVSGASGYKVYRATSSNGTYTRVATITSGSTTSYTNKSLTTGKTYYYKVRAYRTVDGTNVYGGYSSVKSAKPVPSTPSVTAAPAGYSSVKISWAAVSGASGYKVYRATSSSGTYSLLKTTTSTSYTNTSLTTGKTYYYKVKAYHVEGGTNVYGSYSSVKSAKPVPSTPSVTAASAGYSSVKISWKAVSGASGYKVYRATSSSGTYSLLKTTTSNSYTNTSLTTGKTYYYKVKAYHVEGGTNVYGSYSSVKSAKPIPATPSGVKAARASSTSIKVSWSSVSGATGYEVYRATSKTGTYTKVTTTTSKSYTNTGRTRGKTYYYKVRAYRTVSGKKVYGSYSSVVYYKL